ncbi:MAG: hypothetical protein QOD62_2222, partial [Actinomycetota bacterium]|nr:hypothetical protein [Actinomycetota bacterium]
DVTLSNSGATATIPIGNDAVAGDSLTIVVDELTNPASGSYTIGVATSPSLHWSPCPST